MLRPLFKLMAFVFFTLTIIIFVIDSVHSVKTLHWITTPFNKVLANLLQTDIHRFNQSLYNTIPTFLSSICITLTCLPAWSILGAFATICCILSNEQQKYFHKILYTEEYI
ncbi:hypothetical protein LNM86_03160 [Bartonella machadoae]|nr:hypothetical protein LNM86_03160 [Bartonella machadoae]